MKRIVGLLALPALLLAAACGGGSSSSSGTGAGNQAVNDTGSSSVLVGAGSSLVYPLVSQWIPDYNKASGVTITYGNIGSGGGVEAITSRTVDFGASDAPLTPDQASAAKGVLEIPWALAATVVTYNVKGVPDHLKLTGPVLADIFLGTVETWNDPAIAKLNPGVSLPSTKITPVYRSDSSGDTYAFTGYLSAVSPDWKSKVGQSTQVEFPVGVGEEKNSGVAAQVQSTDGSIGYVAISYIAADGLNAALIQNKAGNYPVPSVKSISAAAKAITSVPSDNVISLLDPPASQPEAYPISTYTYALVPQQSSKASTLKKFLTYAIGSGQQFGPDLDFAPLPSQVLQADKATIARIKA